MSLIKVHPTVSEFSLSQNLKKNTLNMRTGRQVGFILCCDGDCIRMTKLRHLSLKPDLLSCCLDVNTNKVSAVQQTFTVKAIRPITNLKEVVQTSGSGYCQSN
ncbi:unnamed protein product [Protopolystoma xenopodis]|uniref:Uncharacterized protein n=1 Tax=Protopolystoma xenopodis TaxID=117903 RepID=A0A3S5B1C8_9PLAT|nr:unnamed protein product [Protopolystoma xenopodis]